MHLLGSVINEICEVFPNKVYSAIEPLIELYRPLVYNPIPESEIEKLEDQKINDLLKEHPRMVNFYKLALKIAREKRAEIGIFGAIKGLMDYYIWTTNCYNLLEYFTEKVKEINPSVKVYEVLIDRTGRKDFEEFLCILDIIKENTTQFWQGSKRSKDFEIFTEFVAMFCGESDDAIFITDDEKFIKRARKSLAILKSLIDVDNLSFYHLDEFLVRYQ